MTLFLSDVDGTLTDGNGIISRKDVEQIKKWQEEGNLFGLVTGRDQTYCTGLLRSYGIKPDCLITSNGANVFFQGKSFSIASISKMQTESLFQAIIPFQKDVIGFVTLENGMHYFYRKEDLMIMMEEQAHLKHFADESIGQITYPVPKISVFVRDALKTAFYLEWLTKNFMDLDVISPSYDYIEISQKGCHKAKALDFLIENFHIDKKGIGFIGDGSNDVPLFEYLDRTYVMAHAPSHIRSCAKTEVKSVSEALKKEREREHV